MSLLVVLLCSGCQDQNGIPGHDAEKKKLPAKDSGKTPANHSGGILGSPPLNEFIPEGYVLLDTATGDLNRDPYGDMVMIVKKSNEKETSDVVDHPEKRPLLLYLSQQDGTYKLAARNDNVVLCIDCGGMMGDPYTGIAISKGYFSIEHYGGSAWRWTRIVTFKYSTADLDWLLHKDGGESFQAVEPEKIYPDIKTEKDFGKVVFGRFDIYADE